MTLAELRDTLNKMHTNPSWDFHKDNEVCIALDIPSIGPRQTTSIRGVFNGFDWDCKKTFIETDITLVPSKQSIEKQP